MSCSVCTESFTRTTRKEVTCANCDYQACVTCVKRFLLDTNTDPHCMNCKHIWDRGFLDYYLPKTWVNGELKRHRADILWDRERSMLPATQPAVEREMAVRRVNRVEKPALEAKKLALIAQGALLNLTIYRARFKAHFGREPLPNPHYYPEHPEMVAVNKEIADFNSACVHSVDYYISNTRLMTLGDKCVTCKREISLAVRTEFRKQKADISNQIKNTTGELLGIPTRIYRILNPRAEGAELFPEEKRQFIAACPSEDCRGFLSTAYKCGVCSKQFCSSCRELKIEGHVCDPALVETIKAIVQNSRPCPSCGTAISKVDGCDQMYCTQCFTAYSYNTGKVVTGVIHNPHYYERMRALHGGVVPPQNRPAEIPCGEVTTLHHAYDRLTYQFVNRQPIISSAYRLAVHMDYTLLGVPRPQRRDRFLAHPAYPQNNEELRVKYMLNELTEKQFKQKVQLNDKKHQKELEIRDSYELFKTLVMDFFLSNLTDETVPQLPILVEEFVNNPLKQIAHRYNQKVELVDLVGNRMAVYSPKATARTAQTTARTITEAGIATARARTAARTTDDDEYGEDGEDDE